jgi:hypothetical protein
LGRRRRETQINPTLRARDRPERKVRWLRRRVPRSYSSVAASYAAPRRAISSPIGSEVRVRGGLDPDAPFYYVGLTEAVGTEVIRRTAAGEKAWGHVARARATPPCWYRIDRSGDVVMAYDSEDGSQWRPIGRQTIPFDGPIHVGLVVCSRFPGERCRSTFDRIQALELSDSL